MCGSRGIRKHLAVLAWQARERKDLIVEQMKKAEGVNQKLQEEDWMEYVRRLQMIEHEAERIVLEEMVYV
ncbi:MAG: TnpV protein [Lachnospiraceae bacterium]|nr:TnpV protein [Lachnospiraceae bacterium]